MNDAEPPQPAPEGSVLAPDALAPADASVARPSGRFAWLSGQTWRWAPVAVPVLVTLAALLLRIIRLDVPDEEIPLDEKHYVPDARDVVAHGTESHRSNEESAFVVHPPVGKWGIALGMKLFGVESPFGWRFTGALLGGLAVLVVYAMGRRLWPARRWPAALAALLLAVEGLWFVQSRVAMLDIYVGFFALLAVWLLLEDRARTAPEHEGVRWWRIASGVAAGLAAASKWGAFPTIAVLFVAAVVWEGARRRAVPALPVTTDEGEAVRPLETPLRALARIVGTFAVLPGLVYLGTHVPWLVDERRYVPPLCASLENRASEWICYQREIYNFHKNLEKWKEEEVGEGEEKTVETRPAHPYFSEVWTWPWMGRPVVHHYETQKRGPAEAQRQYDAEIIGLPNPAVWLPAWLALLPLAWLATGQARRRRLTGALRRRRHEDDADAEPAVVDPPRGGDGTAALILGLVVLNYLPYFVTGFFGRPAFLFYATPMVPFLVLGVVHVLQRWLGGRGRVTLVGVGAYALVAVALFAYFYPVLAAVWIPHDSDVWWIHPFTWDGHMWLTHDCESPVRTVEKLCWI